MDSKTRWYGQWSGNPRDRRMMDRIRRWWTERREKAFRARWNYTGEASGWMTRGWFGYYFIRNDDGPPYGVGSGWWVMVWKDGVVSTGGYADCPTCRLKCYGRCAAVFGTSTDRVFTVEEMKARGCEGMDYFPDWRSRDLAKLAEIESRTDSLSHSIGVAREGLRGH